MAITTTVCDSYTKEIMEGVHTSADTYKMALFTDTATLGAATTTYSATNEVVGAGYTAGGATLTGFATSLDSGVAILDFDDPSWTNATITARGALIYNASKGNKAVAAYDFGANAASTNGTFTVQLPAPTAATGPIRIS